MAKIFISYAMEDGKEAGSLHRFLSLLGYKCFLAHRDIRKGEKWREAIVRELRASDAFVPLLSEHGLKSPWVHQECGMAHLLRGTKKKPFIVPITLKGQEPPGCLSIYQSMNVGVTFWLSKLDIGHDMASKIALEIVEQVDCLDGIKPHAIKNLSGTNLQDYCFILGFLVSSNQIIFDDFLQLINHANSHSGAACSDFVMHHMYRLLKIYYEEINKLPDWVSAWNRLHERYQKYKDDERRRQEELDRKLRQQTEEMVQQMRQKASDVKRAAN